MAIARLTQYWVCRYMICFCPVAMILLLLLMPGCGDSTPAPVKEGRSAFSYDDDEIDPANLQPRKGQAKPRGRR